MIEEEGLTRTAVADIVKAEVGPRYWPYALIVYPLIGLFTFGVGLWVVWALQERRVPSDMAWLRGLGFTLLCFLPLGYVIVASSYGRNLYYISKPEARQFRVIPT
jgi:hypothetical protein